MLERALKVGLTYELLALHTTLPTITSLVWSARSKPLPVFAASVVSVTAGLLFLTHHLLLEGWDEA